MPIFTTDDFRRSVFNIGSGDCLQPVLRLSHLSDTFIYVDYDWTGEQAMAGIKRQLEQTDLLALESVEFHDNLGMHDFPLRGSAGSVIPHLERVLGDDWNCYHSAFYRPLEMSAREGRAPRQWAASYRLTRLIPMPDGTTHRRPVRLILIGGEGLATYLGLSGLGAIAPRGVVSIQLGNDRDGGGVRKMLESCRTKPEFWVRGFETEETSEPEKPLVPNRDYPEVGMRFMGWRGTQSYCWKSTRRQVTAYIPSRPARKASSERVGVGANQFMLRPITLDDIRAADAAIVPPSLARKVRTAAPELAGRLVDTEAILSGDQPMLPFTQAMERVLAHPRVAGAKRIVALPIGYEDESEAMIAFLKATTDRSITLSLPDPLDWRAVQPN